MPANQTGLGGWGGEQANENEAWADVRKGQVKRHECGHWLGCVQTPGKHDANCKMPATKATEYRKCPGQATPAEPERKAGGAGPAGGRNLK